MSAHDTSAPAPERPTEAWFDAELGACMSDFALRDDSRRGRYATRGISDAQASMLMIMAHCERIERLLDRIAEPHGSQIAASVCGLIMRGRAS